ncbi:hypothetical protein PSZ56_24865, partial [Shigella sonnei]|nr:hypothetical protein [Shigella sonnei]
IVSVVTLVWGISPRQPSGKNIIRWLLKKRTNGSVRYCQYTSVRALLAHLLYHVKVLSAQHVDVLSGVRTLRKQHVGWSGQSKWRITVLYHWR